MCNHKVMSDSLWPHGLKHTRLLCPPPSPRVCSNSCPLSLCSSLTTSSSVAPFSSRPPSFPASGSSSESAVCIKSPKSWSFGFSNSPSSEYSGLISFRIDWFDRLAVQGTLKSLLQHHNLKAPIFWHSAFFMVQLSHLYTTFGKNHSHCPQWFWKPKKIKSVTVSTFSLPICHEVMGPDAMILVFLNVEF